MTKQEVNEIISSKAAEYGFEIEENSLGWNNKRTGQDYINIQIFQNSNIEKTDWEKRIGCNGGRTAWENLSGTFWVKQRQAISIAVNNSGGLFRHVLPYLLLGAALGAFIHEVIPEGLLESFIGADSFWAIPLAAVIGIPMYIRTETMIPVASILMTKGVAPSVVIALILGGVGASLPEISLLSSMFTKKMIAAFLASVFTVAIVTGCVFNLTM